VFNKRDAIPSVVSLYSRHAGDQFYKASAFNTTNGFLITTCSVSKLASIYCVPEGTRNVPRHEDES
jgi:hypothetical protein